MVACPLSGPLYIPIMTFGCMTPTTRNVDWLICTVWPTGSSFPKRSVASSSPRKATLALLEQVRSLGKRPPGPGIRFRMGPKGGPRRARGR
jgi:hypothetical protein